MDKLIQLQRGQYAVPDNCRALVYANTVYIFDRMPLGRRTGDKYHCSDCAHRKQGYACWAAPHKTMICTLRPKTNTRGTKGLFYAAPKYGKICSKFKLKKETNQ